MASLSTCHIELVALDGNIVNLVKSCPWLNPCDVPIYLKNSYICTERIFVLYFKVGII